MRRTDGAPRELNTEPHEAAVAAADAACLPLIVPVLPRSASISPADLTSPFGIPWFRVARREWKTACYSFICTARLRRSSWPPTVQLTAPGDPASERSPEVEAADPIGAARGSGSGSPFAAPVPLGARGYFSYDLISSIYPAPGETAKNPRACRRFMLAQTSPRPPEKRLAVVGTCRHRRSRRRGGYHQPVRRSPGARPIRDHPGIRDPPPQGL